MNKLVTPTMKMACVFLIQLTYTSYGQVILWLYLEVDITTYK